MKIWLTYLIVCMLATMLFWRLFTLLYFGILNAFVICVPVYAPVSSSLLQWSWYAK